MIIECINCNKKFNVDANLIPENGRQIQCGSCDYIWHYKVEIPSEKSLILDDKNIQQDAGLTDNQKDKIYKANITKEVSADIVKHKTIIKKNEFKKKNKTQNKAKPLNISNYFSYLVVLVISFVSLIILLDTLKTPLVNIFPSLKIILFNLFETLKDIKLFIIDLT